MLVALFVLGREAAEANGSHSAPRREEAATKFEIFLDVDCAPCVKETYAVANVPIASLRPSGFGPSVASVMARGGEVRFEVIRAHPLGDGEQQMFAMRAVLAIRVGDGQVYRVVAGLVDEEAIPSLTSAIGGMFKALSPPSAESRLPASTEMEFHAGSLRVGVIRVPDAEVAYIQVGDVQTIPPPTTAETYGALFFATADLPAVQRVIDQAAREIKTLRGR
jgi:hypothetical protein